MRTAALATFINRGALEDIIDQSARQIWETIVIVGQRPDRRAGAAYRLTGGHGRGFLRVQRSVRFRPVYGS